MPSVAYSHAIDVAGGNARTSPGALTLDTLRAVRGLSLSRSDLQTLLGCDESDVERLLASQGQLTPQSPEGERAILLVRLHRALGDVYGSLELVNRWLDRTDDDLGATPRDLLTCREGLQRLVRHMETLCKDCLW